MVEMGRGVDTWCPNCRAEVAEDALMRCIICRKPFCPECAVTGYGREFCSERCRDFFFYGDDELESEEES